MNQIGIKKILTWKIIIFKVQCFSFQLWKLTQKHGIKFIKSIKCKFDSINTCNRILLWKNVPLSVIFSKMSENKVSMPVYY